MEIYYDIFFKNTKHVKYSSISEKILALFTTLENVLYDMTKTENIFTFTNTSENQNLIKDFEIVLTEFRLLLTSMVNDYEFQHINMDDLKNRAEILREEDKQKKLNKYNNFDDDQVYIIKELEKVGVVKDDFIPYQNDLGLDEEQNELNLGNVNNSDD